MSSYIGYVYVSLMDENKNMIRKNKGIGKGKPNDPTIWEETEDLEAGTYYLKVNNAKYNFQNTGVYKVMADFRVANNNDKEPNNGIEQAQPLNFNYQKVTGFISSNDDVDYDKLTLPSAGELSVNMSSYIRYVYLSLMDEYKNEI